MDRRGHAMPGMDAVYNHITMAMRQRLCDVLEQLWRDAVVQRYELVPRSAVPLLNQILDDHGPGATAYRLTPQHPVTGRPGLPGECPVRGLPARY